MSFASFFRRTRELFRKYNVEPVLFFYMVARNLYNPTPFNQLVTDKICLIEYQLDSHFCKYISDDKNKGTESAFAVLGDAANYNLYSQMILSIPSIFAAMFLGPWLDMHHIAPKIVLYMTLVAGLFESIGQMLNVIFWNTHAPMLLIPHILNGLTGGNMLLMTAVFTIAMKETPLSERTFRFTIIEFAMVLPNPIANFISGLLLPLKPWIVEDQLRNYLPIYLLAIFLYAVCFLYVIFAIGEIKEIVSPNDDILKRASLRTSLQPMSTEYLMVRHVEPTPVYVNHGFERENDDKDFKLQIEKSTKSNQGDPNNNYIDRSTKDDKQRSLSCHRSLPILSSNNSTKGELLRSLFQKKNIAAMFKSVMKRREEKAHVLLWLTIVIYVILLVASNGYPSIMVNLSLKVYGIPTERYLFIDAIGHLFFGFISTFSLSYFHKIDFEDTKIIILGLSSLLSINLLRGLILNPYGLYGSYLTGSVFLCAIVACRGFVAKIIPKNEIGTVLGALSVFYATSPVIGTAIYTQIYRLTMDSYPGMAFIVVSFSLIISIICAIWLHIRYLKYKTIMENK